MSQLSLLLKKFRLEAKDKLNTDAIFFLEYPNELDLGVLVRLLPHSLREKDQLNALAALPLSVKIKDSAKAINKKLQELNESLEKLSTHPEAGQIHLCSQLPAGTRTSGGSLYQQVRLVENNAYLSQENKLKISMLFLQSLLSYFDLFALMYFLHKSRFQVSNLALNHPVFAGMDDSKKERLRIFASLLSDYKAGVERMEAIADFAQLLCSLRDDGACYGFALYGLDPSLDALNALQRLNPSKSASQVLSELATTLSNKLQPALITFADFCQSAAFLRLQVNALQGYSGKRPLIRNKDPFELSLKVATPSPDHNDKSSSNRGSSQQAINNDTATQGNKSSKGSNAVAGKTANTVSTTDTVGQLHLQNSTDAFFTTASSSGLELFGSNSLNSFDGLSDNLLSTEQLALNDLFNNNPWESSSSLFLQPQVSAQAPAASFAQDSSYTSASASSQPAATDSSSTEETAPELPEAEEPEAAPAPAAEAKAEAEAKAKHSEAAPAPEAAESAELVAPSATANANSADSETSAPKTKATAALSPKAKGSTHSKRKASAAKAKAQSADSKAEDALPQDESVADSTGTELGLTKATKAKSAQSGSKAKSKPRGRTQKTGHDQILGATLSDPELKQAAQDALFAQAELDGSNADEDSNAIASAAMSGGSAASAQDSASTLGTASVKVIKNTGKAKAQNTVSAASANSQISSEPSSPRGPELTATDGTAQLAAQTEKLAQDGSTASAHSADGSTATNVTPNKATAKRKTKSAGFNTQGAAANLATQKELPPFELDAEAEQRSSSAEITALTKRRRVQDYTHHRLEGKFIRASDALKQASTQQHEQRIKTQAISNQVMPLLNQTDLGQESSWKQQKQKDLAEHIGLLQVLDSTPELMRLKYCLLFAQYFLLPEEGFVQLLQTTDPDTLPPESATVAASAQAAPQAEQAEQAEVNAQEPNNNGESVKGNLSEVQSSSEQSATGQESVLQDAGAVSMAYSMTDSTADSVADNKALDAAGLEEYPEADNESSDLPDLPSLKDIAATTQEALTGMSLGMSLQELNSPELKVQRSLLARKLRPLKELKTMHQVLLEMASNAPEQQKTLKLQTAKFNYYAQILGRSFTVVTNSRRTPDVEDNLPRTNLNAYARDPLVQFIVATLILSAYNLYYKVNRNGLFETYKRLQLIPPL